MNYVNVNAPVNPYLFHFQAQDRQQNLTYFMRADGTREGKLSHSAHQTPNFVNPEFQFPQLKVLQSVFFFFLFDITS